jgi:hypothetical protein
MAGERATIHATATGTYVALLRALDAQIRVLAASIGDQLAIHNDAPVFTSLTGRRARTGPAFPCFEGISHRQYQETYKRGVAGSSLAAPAHAVQSHRRAGSAGRT